MHNFLVCGVPVISATNVPHTYVIFLTHAVQFP